VLNALGKTIAVTSRHQRARLRHRSPPPRRSALRPHTVTRRDFPGRGGQETSDRRDRVDRRDRGNTEQISGVSARTAERSPIFQASPQNRSDSLEMQ
jgi:hypothetical protein